MADFTIIDAFALFAAFVLWHVDAWLVEYSRWSGISLSAAVNAQRRVWMRQLVARENRIVDSSLLGNLMHSVAFFASTSIIMLGAVVAMLGAVDHSYDAMRAIPFLPVVSKQMFEVKLVLLLLIFIYSFLKFTWSLRQFNYCCIIIGSAPAIDSSDDLKDAFVDRASRLNELGATSFIEGLRGYYFALASLGWFIHPLAFVIAALLVVLILWRREFHSKTRLALRAGLDGRAPS